MSHQICATTCPSDRLISIDLFELLDCFRWPVVVDFVLTLSSDAFFARVEGVSGNLEVFFFVNSDSFYLNKPERPRRQSTSARSAGYAVALVRRRRTSGHAG
jgi:hypothetical protein